MKCPDCDKTFKGESAKEVMNTMHPHYMEDHKEVIEGADESQKEAWMKKFNEDFEVAKELE